MRHTTAVSHKNGWIITKSITMLTTTHEPHIIPHTVGNRCDALVRLQGKDYTRITS